MMKLTLKQIIEGQESLQKLSGQSLRGRTAFQIGRLLKELENILSDYNDTRVKTIQAYAKKDENGEYVINDRNEYQFDPEQMNQYFQEIEKLISEELEINSNPIKFSDIENLNFTPAEMTFLEPFLDVEE